MEIQTITKNENPKILQILWTFGFASVSAVRTVCINLCFIPEALNINFIHGAFAPHKLAART